MPANSIFTSKIKWHYGMLAGNAIVYNGSNEILEFLQTFPLLEYEVQLTAGQGFCKVRSFAEPIQ